MGVQSRNANYTNTVQTFKESQVITTTTYSGGNPTISQRAIAQTVHMCQRNPHSSRGLTTLSGTTTKFRHSNGYDRGIVDVTHQSGIWREPTNGTTVEGPPDTKSSLAPFAIKPIFDGTVYVVTDSNLKTQADVQALNKLGDQKAQVGADLAQAKLSWNLLADTTIPLWQTLKELKHGRFDTARRILQRAARGPLPAIRHQADWYLAWKFGWDPLLRDAYGVYQVAQEAMKPAMLLEAESGVYDDVTQSDLLSPGGTLRQNGWARRNHRTKIWASVSDSLLRNASKVGLTDPAGIAWEILPWSFVIDWGLPIGNCLQAANATYGLTFVGGIRSVWAEGETRSTYVPPGSYVEDSPRELTARCFSYRRDRLLHFPSSRVYAVSPFKSARTLVAGSLAAQLILKR